MNQSDYFGEALKPWSVLLTTADQIKIEKKLVLIDR